MLESLSSYFRRRSSLGRSVSGIAYRSSSASTRPWPRTPAKIFVYPILPLQSTKGPLLSLHTLVPNSYICSPSRNNAELVDASTLVSVVHPSTLDTTAHQFRRRLMSSLTPVVGPRQALLTTVRISAEFSHATYCITVNTDGAFLVQTTGPNPTDRQRPEQAIRR